jgi:hypothetical protein
LGDAGLNWNDPYLPFFCYLWVVAEPQKNDFVLTPERHIDLTEAEDDYEAFANK